MGLSKAQDVVWSLPDEKSHVTLAATTERGALCL